MTWNIKMISKSSLEYVLVGTIFVFTILFPMNAYARLAEVDGKASSILQTNSAVIKKKNRTLKPKPRVFRRTRTPVALGVWGGDGAILNVAAGRVTIEFTCAVGQIEQTLKIDRKGLFSVVGSYVREQLGPIRIEATQTATQVRYSGKISGSLMELKMVAIDTGKVIGEFRLTRGQTPELRRCS